MIRACILGPSGRMGKELIALAESNGFEITGLVDAPQSPLIGKPVAGVVVTADLAAGLSRAQVYVDFTTPAATTAAARTAADGRVAAVVGTTGLTPEAQVALDSLAKQAGVVWAPNFSLGVNVLLDLAERAAAALGPDYDLRVFEIHHRRKVDAPSGTALALGAALSAGRKSDVATASLRGGDVIGEHTAYLFSDTERLELTHRASARSVFAQGAWRAAQWVVSKPPGRYGMRDVLGLQ
jgi:4-hydroxy-tetrahydrodipicolinate reductase